MPSKKVRARQRKAEKASATPGAAVTAPPPRITLSQAARAHDRSVRHHYSRQGVGGWKSKESVLTVGHTSEEALREFQSHREDHNMNVAPMLGNGRVSGHTRPNAEDMVRMIRDKWHEQTKPFGGYFFRFIDGNRANCALNNLQLVNPYDAFANPDWAVDWDAALSKSEVSFVTLNLHHFAALYEAQKDKSATPQLEEVSAE